MSIRWGPPVDFRIGHGPLETERLLLADVRRLVDELGAALLERPLLVVVPSRSLRLHVIERLLTEHQRAMAGVECRTHHSLAAALLESAGDPAHHQPDPVGLFARRFARREPALARALEHLTDGYRAVVSTVSDLLDAGLDPAHREALEELLEQEGFRAAARADVARAFALIRVAAGAAAAMDSLPLDRSSTLLTKASAILRTESPRLASTVCVYGYSDATGVATDFLESLLAAHGGRVYLDQPPDPAHPDRLDAGVRFSRRFSERLGHAPPSPAPIESTPPSIEMFKALGADAEVLEVATRIRTLLDDGVQPERIGVVARTLSPYRDSIRTQFARSAIPFSGVGSRGPNGPLAYRTRAMLDLLRLAGRAPVERWLESRAPETFTAADYDVRLGLHTLGAGRLDEAAALDITRLAPGRHLTLPFVNGLRLSQPRDDDRTPRPYASRRRLRAEALEREVEQARAALSALVGAEPPLPAHRRLEQLAALMTRELGWAENEPLVEELTTLAERATAGLPDDLLLEREEWLRVLDDAWAAVGTSELGGAGGGVQVLDVIEARGRTFDQLFLVGLNRGTFPRQVHEDPLLPDSLRRVLARSGHGLLPDLPLKLDGLAEERFLFAQLLAASPSATLSWQEVDDEHAFQTPSPLVERLRWSGLDRHDGDSQPELPTARSRFSAPTPETAGTLSSAYEHAVIGGIFGDRERHQFGALLEVALEEARGSRSKSGDAAALAAARLAILAERDPPRGTAYGEATYRRLGPYLGLIGAAVHPQDPRLRNDVYVTRLEGLARCPWQTFLQKILALEPLPDPLEVLPAMEPRLLGNLVHRVLERLTAARLEDLPPSLEEARHHPGVDVPWPDAAALEHLTRDCAAELAVEEGIALPGFDRVLARFAQRYLLIVREADWPDGPSRNPVLAAEYASRLEWPDRALDIAFRADRIDRVESGLVVTDYKTGRKVFGQEKVTAGSVAAAVAAGQALQGVAYVLAAGGPDDSGRYLFVHPELDETSREVLISNADQALVAAFTHAVNATLDAWTTGGFFPRLVEPLENREPRTCSLCDVAEACVRGDSGARGRLRDWNQMVEASDEELTGESTDRSMHTLWMLPASARGKR